VTLHSLLQSRVAALADATLYARLQNDPAISIDPTRETYSNLGAAFDFFNDRFYDGKLPRPLITLQRSHNAEAFYRHRRFGTAPDIKGRVTHIDEIAMNPRFFLFKSTEEILSTLVHEQVHLKQFHFGKPSRNGYHNGEFRDFMKEVGLITSDTDAVGGKQTGQRMGHYVDRDGPFAKAYRDLIEVHGFRLIYGDIRDEVQKTGGLPKPSKPKNSVASTYICTNPACAVKLTGAPLLRVVCEDCALRMIERSTSPRLPKEFAELPQRGSVVRLRSAS
jgi:hypothetical protein